VDHGDPPNRGHWPQIAFPHLSQSAVLNSYFEHGDRGSRVSAEVPLVGVEAMKCFMDVIFLIVDEVMPG
jgi:hypothetical protein